MIPRLLTLKNFLSYRDASLDFRGLHVACVCGPNGAGKSSLLEAIAWAVWGQSRVASEDDIIHAGEMEALVDFSFEHNQQHYRILRGRRRTQGGILEFQVYTEAGWRSLTQRGMRATQQLISQHLKLDYDTFVNSAYLRQGRADDFMLKRPSDRKQILADLLKLDRYDQLAEAAKDRCRQAQTKINLLQQQATVLDQQLQCFETTAQSLDDLEAALTQLTQQQQTAQQQLQALRQQTQQRRTLRHQFDLQQQQQRHLQQQQQLLLQEQVACQHKYQALAQTLNQADAIATGLEQLRSLQDEESRLADQFQRLQQLQKQRTQLVEQTRQALQTLESQLQRLQLQRQTLQEQLQELAPTLAKRTAIETALAQLQAAKAKLQHYDQLQLQVQPLMKRRQQLQNQLETTQTRIRAKLEELTVSQQQLNQQQAQQPQLMQAVQDVSASLEYLEQRRVYQEQVREKGLERRSFMERLQAKQRLYETQLAELDQKIRFLEAPDAACPVCDRSLDHHHGQLVLERYRAQQEEIQSEIWVIREQLTTSQREIQVLRQEYREVEAELTRYGVVHQWRGRLEAQVSSGADLSSRLQQLQQERHQLERCLQEQSYGSDLFSELHQIDQTLAELDYDDRNHALCRGQVDRLRWADIRHSELLQAQRKYEKLKTQLPEIEQRIADLQHQQQTLAQAPRSQIAELERQIQASGYSLEQHDELREHIRLAQQWPLQQQQLEQAQQQQPQVQQRLQELQGLIQNHNQELQQLASSLEELSAQLQPISDPAPAIVALETELASLQQQRETTLAELGALQQRLNQLQQQRQEQEQLQTALTTARQKARVYGELAQAFGRNGIQALMIENLLPQLETETNHLLGRLSNHQLHVQFVTQRASRRQHKLIDTLDILIADSHGTRPYETYSGGEAFRVNFAIRLALARLLAQRSGMALQMLIIDEGFGTQDREGCQRLIAAINAIAADFSCILTITHVPHFREAFQTRIDVLKTETGSQLVISG